MERVYKGKTKDVYDLGDGYYQLRFKDDVTGEDGKFDPGANTVGLSIEGVGKAGLRLTAFFFERLNDLGIPTHFVSADLEEGTMTVRKAKMFGQGVEHICRFRAVGSFMRRYGMYAEEGQPLDSFVEVTLKDDDRNDPPITDDALEMLGILTRDEYRELKELTVRISNFVKDELAKKGMELYDIKLEFGRIGEDGRVGLIDEISGGNMRAFKDGEQVHPLELERLMS